MTVPLTGVVLVGGRSTRMGRDKALVRVGGQRMVDRAVGALQQVCDKVLVAGGARTLDGLEVPQVPDAAGEGPLAGIVAGLDCAATPLLAVVAVDMPHASGEVFRLLADLWRDEVAVAPRVGGVVQPLHAVYATAAAGRFRALLAAGERSPGRALALLDALVVDDAALRAAGAPAGFARNVNAPADLPRSAPAPRGAH